MRYVWVSISILCVLTASAKADQFCFALAETYYEQVYCQLQAKAQTKGLPSFNQFKKNKTDVGSCEVQIALLSEQIKQVATHLKSFPKDLNSQRGLVIMVGKRKTFLNYLKKNNPESYNTVSQLLKSNGYQ